MSMAQVDSGWRFDKNYDNLAQVEPFLPAFLEVLAELEAAGKYRYNASFQGRIPGIEGPDEDTAIYLLQGLERQAKQDQKVAGLLAEGYEWVDSLPSDGRKYAHIVLVPQHRMGGEWAEWESARLLMRNSKPYAILPKGKRTHGHLVMGRRVLAKAVGA